MSLLYDIQKDIVETNGPLGPSLMKLRLLASKLGSNDLEMWVKYESEGYPDTVSTPDYRNIELSYFGDFMSAHWKATKSPIPTYLIRKHCGVQWVNKEMRESISSIDELVLSAKAGQEIGIDCADLILLLQGKIYPEMNCLSVTARISHVALQEIQNNVRNKILELSMSLEKEVPKSATISIGSHIEKNSEEKDILNHIVNMTVHGPNTMITNTGDHASISVKNIKGDKSGLVDRLVNSGVPASAANEFASILDEQKQQPNQTATPFGEKAQKWLSEKLGEISSGAWGITLAVAAKTLEDAAKDYLGLN